MTWKVSPVVLLAQTKQLTIVHAFVLRNNTSLVACFSSTHPRFEVLFSRMLYNLARGLQNYKFMGIVNS